MCRNLARAPQFPGLVGMLLLAGCEMVPTVPLAHSPGSRGFDSSPSGVLVSGAGVDILGFAPAYGTRLAGEGAASAVTLRNTGTEERTFWVGYSVQDPSGVWHDVPSGALVLAPGDSSAPHAAEWTVPGAPEPEVGFYRAAMSVWDSAPEEGGATRLASIEQFDAFRVDRVRDDTDRLDTEAWFRASHRLGRGTFHPENVLAAHGTVSLRLPAKSRDGGEIRTRDRYLHGRYTARMRTPKAKGSLSAFFLYEDVPGGNDEIDIEILNDGSRVAILSVWIKGVHRHEVRVTLPFDPRDALHDYTIDFQPGQIAFFADGRLLHRWVGEVPQSPMKLMANSWWPSWLSGPNLPEHRYTEIEWIRF